MTGDHILIGYHAIEEALRSGSAGGGILHISRKNERIRELVKLAGSMKIKIKRESDETLSEITREAHRGVALELNRSGGSEELGLEGYLKNLKDQTSLVLILDGITDPQNLGAILRSADQFGVDLVLLPSRRSAGMGPTVMKTSAGAAAYLKVTEVANLGRAIDQLKKHDFWIYGADLGGVPLWECEFENRSALVMGAEGRGVGRLVSEQCDRLVTIPTSGHVDSLNVSVATGIVLYEFRRRSSRGYS